MKSRSRASVVEAFRFALVLLLSLIFSGGAEIIVHGITIVQAASPVAVTLTTAATPGAAEPGVTFVSVTGTGFPAGTIGPADVTVTLAPVSSGPAMTAVVQSVTTIIGPTRKVTFQVSSAHEVTSPTAYLVSLSGSAEQGSAFASTNSSSLTINPPASIVSLTPSSGKVGQSLSVGITGLFSNFFQGATTASFGPGISVGGAAAGAMGPVTVNSLTSATASLVIGSGANPAVQNVTVQTGAEIESLNSGFTVSPTASSTTITGANASAVFSESSQSVTLSATVTSGAGTVNAGSVVFTVFQGGTPIGSTSGSVTNGAASANFTLPANTAAGTYTIAASYVGGGSFASSGPDTTHSLTVNQAATTTTAANASASFSTSNQTVPLTVTVTSPAGAVNAGTVAFTVWQGTTQIGSAVTSGAVTAGAASAPFVLPGSTTAGSYTIQAVYSGTSNLTTSSDSTHTLTVGSGATTTTAANETATFSESSQSVTLSANVTSGAGTVGAGTVTFTVSVGGTQVGTSVTSGTVTGGAANASFTVPAGTAARPYTITAVYNAAGGFATSSDNTHTLTINSAGTTTTAANASASFSTSSQSVGLTATVTSGAGAVNVGTVTFTVKQGATVVGTAVTSGTVTAGAASVSYTLPGSTAVGSYTIAAVYNPGTNFLTSSDTSHTLSIGSNATAMKVTPSANPSVFGQSVTFTATVSPVAPATGTPTGTVTFLDGGSSIGTGTLSGGTATFTTSALVVGSHTITTSYGGDASFSGSTGSLTGNPQVVNKTNTTTAVTSSANPSVFGQSVTLTATLSPVAPGAGTPTGTVTFLDGGSSIGTGTLSSGSATFSTSALAVGSHTITTSYGGDANFNSSTGSLTGNPQVVSKTNTTTAVTSSVNPSAVGQSVTFTAKVSPAAPGSGTPSGTVTFLDGGSSIGTGTLSGGSATFSTSSLASGSHTITTSYGGDASFNGDTGSLTGNPQVVNQNSSTTAAANAAVTFSESSQSVTLSATVTSGAGTVGAGTVTFTVKQGATVIGSAVTSGTVTGGAASASFAVPANTAAGPYTIAATYSGGGGFAGSSDNTHTLTINSAGTTTTAANATASFSTSSQSVGLTATVTSGAGAVNVGTVTFTVKQGATVIGSAVTSGTVTAGAASASFTLPGSTASGAYTIQAAYNAGTNFLTSSDTTHTLTVSGSGATTTVAANQTATFSETSQSVGLTATVTSGAGTVNAGTVTFTVSMGGTQVGSSVASGTVTGGAASASYTVPANTAAGAYTITAVYNAAGGFATSSDNTHTLTIGDAGTTTVAANESASFSTSSQSVGLTATVTSGAGAVNVGTVTFTVKQGATVIGSAVTSGTVAAGAASAMFTLPGSTASGAYTIQAVYNAAGSFLTSSDTTHTLTVSGSGTPTLVSVSPNAAQPSNVVTVTITGANTHFVNGTTKANFGPGVAVGTGSTGGFGTVTVTSSTTATAQISVAAAAALGGRIVSVQTGSEQESLVNAFFVNGAPAIASISPAQGSPGQTLTVTITGSFTNFVNGTTTAIFGAGITVNSVTVTSATAATASITINAAAAVGLRSPVSAQTGAQTASLANGGFLVLGPVTGGFPVVTITNPTEGSEITSPTAVTGTVTSPNFASWTLGYEAAGSTVFTTFATGTTSTVSGTLDPTLLLNGIATIQLTGVDQSGQTSTAVVHVTISRNLKIGNFTLSFTDLTVPVTGIPIQIIRTYDSRNKSVGDFGFGWALSIKTTQVTISDILGNNWEVVGQSGELGLTEYCVEPNQNYVVSVALQGGAVYQFAPQVTPATQCQLLGGSGTVDLEFTPIGNTPANATLVQPNSTDLLVESDSPGSSTQLIDQNTFDVYGTESDADGWTLTLPSGQQLTVSVTFGIQSITDTNGNTLTIGAGGITSSSGKGVVFARDGQNRITTITDPDGKVLTYAYDAAGDLTTFTDQLENVSTYVYDDNHYLLSYKDPSGNQPMRSVYDDSGRLIQVINAFGDVTNFTHNMTGMADTITDALGNPTTFVYDGDGNVLNVTDALGDVYSFTYDANDNELTKTDPLGRTTTYTYDANNNRLSQTDPLGHVTTFTYNAMNQVATVTDANGLTTTNTYDAGGNVLTSKDPLGNTTTNTFNASGLRTSATDALGKTTSYGYDSFGDMTSQTDPAGNVASFSFDGNGNPLTQALMRTTTSGPQTLTVQYQYDAENNEVKTVLADGQTTQTTYNPEGQKTADIDQLGRQTSYQYDIGGRLTQITYADGTSESNTFDVLGRRTQHVARTGAIWLYSYDKLGHLVSTTDPLGGITSTTYDAAGQIIANTDPLGNTVHSAYDAAGNLTSTTDALGNVATFAYDAGNRRISMTDANGHTTNYQYDAAGHQIKVTYPDATFETTAYDARGNVTSRTDAAGKTTQYAYTTVGQLASVTDALGHITTYAYDEVGNRVGQTDANSHTTTFQYDQLGRRIGRVFPAGQTEAYGYDAVGNVASHTDFNGKTTTYSYDSLNRLLSKTPDASFHAPAVTYTYTLSGKRASMTDSTGTTTYTYDSEDRLVEVVKPNGTVSYSYDLAGNMTSLNGGTAVDYAYDADNRLKSVSETNTGTTDQTYDAVGNMAGMTYPNGVAHAYTYNSKNQLTNLGVTKGATSVASYAYTLDAVGHRLTVADLGTRTVQYAYDGIYRLISETVSGATVGPNGAVSYTYDPVANRTQTTSTLAGISAGSFTYDSDNRLTSDTYDADGNTVSSGATSYTYDFENHVIQQGSVTMTYDGDGNRVSKTVGGVTTKYLVSDLTPTGFPQVVEETISNGSTKTLVYGLTRISQRQFVSSSSTTLTSFYVYDGHGSVRALTDATGAVTDTYDYDAFGNLIHSTGSTPNEFLFAGEQFDSDLGVYYNRARYLKTSTGRFLTTDTYEGDPESPLSLHLYLYDSADPVNRIDPSGHQDIGDVMVSLAISAGLDALSYTSIGGSAIDFVGRMFANALVPPWVYTVLGAAVPNAGVVGVSGSYNAPLGKIPLVGVGAAGGLEVLFSPNGAALYGYLGGAVTLGQQALGGGFQGYVGAVWNCPKSSDYTESFLTLTIPFSVLLPSLQRKVVGQIVTAALAGTIAAYGYPAIQSLVGYAAQFAGNIVTTGSFNLFWTPWIPFYSGSAGISFSAGIKSWGASAQKYIGIADTYYWQLLPGGTVTF